jgi:hypothetical protein
MLRRIAYASLGVVLLGLLATSTAGAMPNARRTTHFTFSRVVQLPGVFLPAGTYIFEVVNPDLGGDLVRVLSGDRSKVHLMQFTRAVHRPRMNGMKPTLTLGESSKGIPPPITAWYPLGESIGREFIYH